MSKRSKGWRQRERALRRPGQQHAAPGTVRTDPEAPQPRITLIAYGPDAFHEQQLTHVEELAGWRGRHPVMWVNVDGLGNAEVILALGRLFALHPLALEDVVNTHQRAKCDDYGDVLFCVARMTSGPPLVSEQISFFVGADFVLTFQEDRDGDSLEPVRQRLRQSRGRIRHVGTDYLLYELFDSVIEGYFPILETFGDRLDELDRETDYRDTGRKLVEIHRLRSELLFLRRIVWPHRDALQTMLRAGHPPIRDETLIYLRDSYDHMVQLIDIVEIYRETCADMRDFLYAKLGNRTNEVMRMLTVISTLFLPMTFVAGVYGMNFARMPELEWPWGYPLSLAIMAAIAIGFLVFFQRRGWLQSAEPLVRPEDESS